MEKCVPRYSIGEFVVCFYDYLDFYAYIYDEESDTDIRHYGIITRADCRHMDYLGECLYEVLCLDGENRYFTESEIKLAYCR